MDKLLGTCASGETSFVYCHFFRITLIGKKKYVLGPWWEQ